MAFLVNLFISLIELKRTSIKYQFKERKRKFKTDKLTYSTRSEEKRILYQK